jgi:hypothetical protein
VGRDAFGMQLHYHNGDFSDGPSAFTGTRSEALFKGLYNGNIAGWSHTSRSEKGTPQTTMLSMYSYDKLNRLKQDQPYTIVNNASTMTSKWSLSYSYDPDGNITNLMRTTILAVELMTCHTWTWTRRSFSGTALRSVQRKGAT